MKGKNIKNPQLNVFRVPLISIINMDHELVVLAQKIDWEKVEKEFSIYYPELGRLPETVLVDRGCKGRKSIMGVNIKISGSGKGKTAYQKVRERERFRRRASIEPIIGHLKQDHRMLSNYLKGVEGDMINTLMAGAAFNMVKM